MSLDFLKPVNAELIGTMEKLHPSALGQKILLHTKDDFPDLDQVKVAVFGVRENRREVDALKENFGFNRIRQAFYSLFPGNWQVKIADLGDIEQGETVEDTQFALRETVNALLEENVIPFILGGSQDLTYAQYRAYDYYKEMVNLVTIDARFDIGNSENSISDISYVGKMIVEKPYNLFNYANLGYQTYLNPPEEIDLIERLFFEAYRLGDLRADMTLAEPVLRDADLVSLDINSIMSVFSDSLRNQPNGFDGREACVLSRYAGISDKVSSFGLYGLHNLKEEINPLLPAEIIWHFIEGVNYRKDEENIFETNKVLKYNVLVDEENLTFYKSKHSGRWWIEIPTFVNNKLKTNTFLPCSQQDYLEACNQEIPERWYKARRKNEL